MEKSKKIYEFRYTGIEFLNMSSWQRADWLHPSGTGKPGYRAVYKTLKLVPFPAVNLSWANSRVRMLVEKIEIGGVRVKGETFQTIFPNNLLLAESIEIDRVDKSVTYRGKTNMHFHFEPYIEEIPQCGIVEILLEVENKNDQEVLTEGRRRVSPVLTILDLVYGERLIGSLIAEELVEIFPDGHWNRKAISPSVGSESQLDLKGIEKSQIEQMKRSLEAYSEFGETDRKNIVLATDWFWKSERKSDRIDKFIELWICLEALEMTTTDIKPISEQLAVATDEDYDFWKEPVGRLFGKRSDLVHGKSNVVERHEVTILRGITKILLGNKLGKIEDPDLKQEIISLVKIHFK